jgi:hypothetical protein
MPPHIRQTLLAALLAASFAAPAGAALTCNGIYGVSLTVGGTTEQRCMSTAQEFIDQLSTSQLQSLTHFYNDSMPATIAARFNDVNVAISFPDTGTTLNFIIPELGVNQSFTGATRDDSKKQLGDFLKKNGDILSRIWNYQAKNSPTSPITGPTGMIPMAVAGDFNTNFTDFATNIAAPAAAVQQAGESATQNLINAGVGYQNATLRGLPTKVYTVPLSYTFRNDLDPRRQLTLSIPLHLVEVNSAKSYHFGLGIGARFPMNDNWTLSPNLKFSLVGSVDQATVAGMYSGSLTSTYILNFDKFDLVIGNMVGYYKTAKFRSGSYAFDPGIAMFGLRNGIMLSQPVTLGGKKLSAEYSFIDTRFTGDKPFVDNLQEIGFTLGTNKNAYTSRSFFRAGLTYSRGKGYNSWGANIGYWF